MARKVKAKRRRGRTPVPPKESPVRMSVLLRKADMDSLRRLGDLLEEPPSTIVGGLVRRYLRILRRELRI
ncbi:MAG: hypothetical protein HUU06_08880 [Planctomycetaceae bacterium]|nr:hypothetical protein [Planctomycetaceae bacterium]